MANSGQGGWNWLCGRAEALGRADGPPGRKRRARCPAGATRFTAYSSRNASNTPRVCTSLPVLPSLMIQPRLPATVSSASVIYFRWISVFCRVCEIMLLRPTSWAKLGYHARESLSPMRARLDATDWRILKELQSNGRISNVDLARKVGISPPPCLRRVRALEQAGMIAGYFGMLDEKSVGFEVIAFAMVGLHSQAEADLRAFENRVLAWPLVRECYMLSGEDRFPAQVRRARSHRVPGFHHRRADGGVQCGERQDDAGHPPREVRARRPRGAGTATPRRMMDLSSAAVHPAHISLAQDRKYICDGHTLLHGPAGRQARDGRAP